MQRRLVSFSSLAFSAMISAPAMGQTPVDDYIVNNGLCSLYEEPEAEIHTDMPFGKHLYEWTDADVAAFIDRGLYCTDQEGGGAETAEQQEYYRQKFLLTYSELGAAVDAAKRENGIELKDETGSESLANQSAAATAPCLSALLKHGVSEEAAGLPLAYQSGQPLTIGRYLCQFLRTEALGRVQLRSDDALIVELGEGTLRLEQKKMMGPDDPIYADPNVSSPGPVYYAVVEIDAAGEITRLNDFESNLQVIMHLQSLLGAPFVD